MRLGMNMLLWSTDVTGSEYDQTFEMLGDAGYDTALYELHYAVKRALDDPKTGKRYRDRKRAFVAAR